MQYTLGVIGAGNMGSALVRGIVRAGALAPEQVLVFDTAPQSAQTLVEEVGVVRAASAAAVASDSAYVLLALKPGIILPVVREIGRALSDDQVLISIAAAVPLAQIAQALTTAKPALVRVMPNTPALVGAGLLAVAAPGVPPEKVAVVERLLAATGRVVRVDESLMDAVTGLSGSGPGFVFLVIEALADGGVAAGLPRPIALELAAQTVLGSAKLLLETGEHPAALKDKVATPGGTTIAGLTALERAGVRAALIAAVEAAAERARELSNR